MPLYTTIVLSLLLVFARAENPNNRIFIDGKGVPNLAAATGSATSSSELINAAFLGSGNGLLSQLANDPDYQEVDTNNFAVRPTVIPDHSQDPTTSSGEVMQRQPEVLMTPSSSSNVMASPSPSEVPAPSMAPFPEPALPSTIATEPQISADADSNANDEVTITGLTVPELAGSDEAPVTEPPVTTTATTTATAVQTEATTTTTTIAPETTTTTTAALETTTATIAATTTTITTAPETTTTTTAPSETTTATIDETTATAAPESNTAKTAAPTTTNMETTTTTTEATKTTIAPATASVVEDVAEESVGAVDTEQVADGAEIVSQSSPEATEIQLVTETEATIEPTETVSEELSATVSSETSTTSTEAPSTTTATTTTTTTTMEMTTSATSEPPTTTMSAATTEAIATPTTSVSTTTTSTVEVPTTTMSTSASASAVGTTTMTSTSIAPTTTATTSTEAESKTHAAVTTAISSSNSATAATTGEVVTTTVTKAPSTTTTSEELITSEQAESEPSPGAADTSANMVPEEEEAVIAVEETAEPFQEAIPEFVPNVTPSTLDISATDEVSLKESTPDTAKEEEETKDEQTPKDDKAEKNPIIVIASGSNTAAAAFGGTGPASVGISVNSDAEKPSETVIVVITPEPTKAEPTPDLTPEPDSTEEMPKPSSDSVEMMESTSEANPTTSGDEILTQQQMSEDAVPSIKGSSDKAEESPEPSSSPNMEQNSTEEKTDHEKFLEITSSLSDAMSSAIQSDNEPQPSPETLEGSESDGNLFADISNIIGSLVDNGLNIIGPQPQETDTSGALGEEDLEPQPSVEVDLIPKLADQGPVASEEPEESMEPSESMELLASPDMVDETAVELVVSHPSTHTTQAVAEEVITISNEVSFPKNWLVTKFEEINEDVSFKLRETSVRQSGSSVSTNSFEITLQAECEVIADCVGEVEAYKDLVRSGRMDETLQNHDMAGTKVFLKGDVERSQAPASIANGTGLNAGIIAGIAIGGVAVVSLVALGIAIAVKKHGSNEDEDEYDQEKGNEHGGGDYRQPRDTEFSRREEGSFMISNFGGSFSNRSAVIPWLNESTGGSGARNGYSSNSLMSAETSGTVHMNMTNNNMSSYRYEATEWSDSELEDLDVTDLQKLE